jgi:hypothetical protein
MVPRGAAGVAELAMRKVTSRAGVGRGGESRAELFSPFIHLYEQELCSEHMYMWEYM